MAAAGVGREGDVYGGWEDEQGRKTAEEEVNRGRGDTCSQCLRL